MRFKSKQTLAMTTQKLIIAACSALVILTGCGSTNTTRSAPLMVGPGANMQSGPSKKVYSYNSDIYLDVAIPVFNPGFPIDQNTGNVDYEELGEMDIWPQLRRAEAKRFAIQTKQAMEKTKAFGSISNVPDANTTADLFILGTVNHSDSEEVILGVTVMDSSGEIWGQQDFEHTVSQYFFRDAENKGENPYEPVFTQITDYVYDLLKGLSEDDKQTIKNTTMVRYAQYYSPEVFNQYIDSTIKKKGKLKYYKFDLVGMPADDDNMIKRIETLRAQDLLFVDKLQNQFEAFDAETEVAYRRWQEETLPQVAKAREAKAERNTKVALGVLAGVAAALLAKNSGSSMGQAASIVGGVAAAWSLKDAYQANESLKVHRAVIDEMGQGLDIDLSPTVMDFKDKSIELTGTASEQYQQWKAHLRDIYELEATPDVSL